MRAPHGVALCAALTASALSVTAAAAERRAITLLHSSDIHGRVLPVDDSSGAALDHSLAHIAALVEKVRGEVTHPVLVLDSGDAIQGTPFELFVNVRWQRPSPVIEAMNRIGYDAMAVGNHEFNFGLEVLRRAQAHARFPLLGANIIDETSGEPAFPPYRIVDADGVRIGVLGLVTPNVPGWERPENYHGLRFTAMDDAARRWVPLLRRDEGCDLVVVLAHTGFEEDLSDHQPTGSEVEDFAARLTRVPGIDVLLTGHTHQDIPPRMMGQTIVSQPAAHARRLTRIDLELAAAGDGWRLTGWRGSNLDSREVAPHAAVLEAFAADHRQVVEALAATLTEVQQTVSVARCRLQDCAALDLIHAVQLASTGAELSLAAILSDRTPELPPGPLSWHWVHGLYVYPNTLLKLAVTGQQVKDILEHIARYYDGLDCAPGGGCTVLTDPRVARYNVDSMAGLSYRIDPTQEEGRRVWDLRFEGRPLALHRSFTLACNNYRAAGGGGFPHLRDAEVLWTSSAEMTELIGGYLERMETWPARSDGNWALAPRVEREKTLPD